jgi:hypothetical protein
VKRAGPSVIWTPEDKEVLNGIPHDGPAHATARTDG